MKFLGATQISINMDIVKCIIYLCNYFLTTTNEALLSTGILELKGTGIKYNRQHFALYEQIRLF